MNAAILLTAMMGQFTVPDSDFAREIVEAYPRLVAAGVSDHERVVMLRQWAWSHTNSVLTSTQASLWTTDPAWNAMDAPGYYARFSNEEGGVICGGAANGLMKLYRYFGFKAFYLGSCGGTNVGHATTLVQINWNGELRWVIQDSFYNEDFRDMATNEPLDYFDMLQRLKDRKDQSIRVVESDFHAIRPWPKVVIPLQYRNGFTDVDCIEQCNVTIDACSTCKTRPNGTLEITSPRSWQAQFDKRCLDRMTGVSSWHLQRFVDNGNPPSMLYYFRWCHRVSPVGPDADAIKAQAVAIAGVSPQG